MKEETGRGKRSKGEGLEGSVIWDGVLEVVGERGDRSENEDVVF